jgi:hypothetical protein
MGLIVKVDFFALHNDTRPNLFSADTQRFFYPGFCATRNSIPAARIVIT